MPKCQKKFRPYRGRDFLTAHCVCGGCALSAHPPTWVCAGLGRDPPPSPGGAPRISEYRSSAHTHPYGWQEGVVCGVGIQMKSNAWFPRRKPRGQTSHIKWHLEVQLVPVGKHNLTFSKTGWLVYGPRDHRGTRTQTLRSKLAADAGSPPPRGPPIWVYFFSAALRAASFLHIRPKYP